MKVTLTEAEYQAVNALRGLPPNAHLLIMCSRMTPTGGELDGSEEDFEELVSHLSGEIASGVVPRAKVSALWKLCVKIDPACAAWLGM